MHNGLGLVFPSEKPLRIEILSIFVVVSLKSQATDAKQQNVSIHCKTNSKHKKYVTKMKKLIVILIISLSICIGEIFLLIHLFPQTGLARIVYIPFYIILMILLTIILFRKIKDKELKKQIIYWIIFHFLIFNFIIWSWPDDGKRVNIIGKFYDNLF